jgi:hypothetical protein
MFKSRIHRPSARSSPTNRLCTRTLGAERLEVRLALSHMAILPPPPPAEVISTVPPAPSPAEQNPYGVAIAPPDFVRGGTLQPGDTLVANFNGAANVQGTGTTIVRITPAGVVSTFYTSSLSGLTTTPVILKSGFVIVGNVPNNGNNGINSGALQVLDKNGNLVETITDSALLNDPWGLAVNDQGQSFQVFVSNVNGTASLTPSGIVTRVDMKIVNNVPAVQDIVKIGSGYSTGLNAGALVVGPGGLAYDSRTKTLYVAAEAESVPVASTVGKSKTVTSVVAGTIFAIPDASATFHDHGKGRVVFANATYLHGPMGLAAAPNGDLITANSDAVNVDPNQLSELVEFTPGGRFVSEFSVDPVDAGSAFALAFGTIAGKERLAAVDDFSSTLDIWTLPGPVAGQASSGGSFDLRWEQQSTAATDAVIATLYGGSTN